MSGRNWTPYQIEILLHHHMHLGPFPRQAAPRYEPEVHHLTKLGVLEPRDGLIRTSQIGAALVEMLLQTPLPRSVIIDPRTGKEVQPEAHDMPMGGVVMRGSFVNADGPFDPSRVAKDIRRMWSEDAGRLHEQRSPGQQFCDNLSKIIDDLPHDHP